MILTSNWLSELIKFSVPNRSGLEDLDQGIVSLKNCFSAARAWADVMFSLLSLSSGCLVQKYPWAKGCRRPSMTSSHRSSALVAPAGNISGLVITPGTIVKDTRSEQRIEHATNRSTSMGVFSPGKFEGFLVLNVVLVLLVNQITTTAQR